MDDYIYMQIFRVVSLLDDAINDTQLLFYIFLPIQCLTYKKKRFIAFMLRKSLLKLGNYLQLEKKITLKVLIISTS